MKPYGLRADQRAFEQKYYGGYCNKMRDVGLDPLPYHQFQEELREVLQVVDLTKKKRMQMMIDRTFKTQDEDKLKWECDSCNSIWYESIMYTYHRCPKCGSENFGHW